MAAVHIDESKQIISHEINNRLNSLALGISVLEINSDDIETQTVVRSLKLELRDLQELIEHLKSYNR